LWGVRIPMNDRIKCVNCGDYDCNWEGHQDGTTECLNCSHDRTTGEKVSDEPSGESNLPVAARVESHVDVGEIKSDFIYNTNNQTGRILVGGDELVRKVDAEDAIQEARRRERQKILDKLEEIRDNFQHRVEVALEEKEDAKEDSWTEKKSIERINCFDLAQRKIQELCEDFESSNHADSAEGLRDDLQQEERDQKQ